MPEFTIELHHSWKAASHDWSVLAQGGVPTPFQTPHWMNTWYGTLGSREDVTPLIVSVARRGDATPFMMVPLVQRREGAFRTIEFADLWATDYNAPLIEPDVEFQPQIASRLTQQILAALPAADMLRLNKMPRAIKGSVNPFCLTEGLKLSDFAGHRVHLPDTWDSYLASLKKDMRKLLKRRWTRFLELEGGAGHRQIKDANEARSILRKLDEQQALRLDRRGLAHNFGNPLYRQLYEKHVMDGLADGSAVMMILHANNEVVATFLALTADKRCTLVRTSQLEGENWKTLGLGKAMIAKSMEVLHAQGCRDFDLSIGQHAYKDDFGVVAEPLFDLTRMLSWRAMPTVGREHAKALISKNPRVASFARTIRRAIG